jgi:transcription initiation factor IIE alpha subunit
MSATLDLPPSVRELSSPSARLVYLALREADASLTTEDLVVETGVSLDSCRRVLNDLCDEGLIESRTDPTNRRRKVWQTTR